MGIAHEVAKAVGHAARGIHAGDDELASRKLVRGMAPQLVVTSAAFAPQGRLPIDSTVEGGGWPPPIAWRNAPAETRSLALICEDPDAPFPEPFVHWLVYGIDAKATSVASSDAIREGKNSKLASGFTPAAPPPGHGTHHYHFQLYALDCDGAFEPGLGRGPLLARMGGHVLAWGELVGTFEVTK